VRTLIASIDNSKKIQYGGKHVHQELLEKGLKELGVEVDYLYPNPITLSKKTRIALSHPFSTLRHLISHTTDATLFISMVEANIREFRYFELDDYDIVHAHDSLAAISLPEHKNLIITLHGYLAKEMLDYNRFASPVESRRVYDHMLSIELQALSRASLVITVDNRLKNYVVNELGFSEKDIVVMQNAVDTTRFCPVSNEVKLKLREELDLPTDKTLVLVPRRLVPKNGVVYAAEAAKSLYKSSFFFVFLGDGPEKQRILNVVEGLDNVLLLPPVPNSKVQVYYQAADVVLVPSVTSNDVQEATSLSMLEGMACGKPVVCSNIGGMAEVVRDGVNGFLVEESSVESICEKLLYIRESPELIATIGKAARAYVEENHSYLQHAAKILSLYRKVLSETTDCGLHTSSNE